MKEVFIIFEFIEEVIYKNKKVKLHYLGFKGNFTVLAQLDEFNTIAKGKTIKETKIKALQQIDKFNKLY